MARQKGTGRLFKRSGVFYLRYAINGQRKTISLKVTRKDDKKEEDGTITKGAETLAREYLEPIEAKTKEQIAIHIAEAKQFIKSKNKILLSDTWEIFERKYLQQTDRKITGTFKNYKRQWNRFAKWIAKHYPRTEYLDDINKLVAKEYMDYLTSEKKLSSETYNQHRGTHILIFKTVLEELPSGINPWEQTQRRKVVRQSRKYLDDEQISNILSVWKTSDFKIRFKNEYETLFYLGVYTGQRLGDCCLMKFDYINLNNEIVSFTPSKTKRINRTVTIPIFPELMDRLKQINHSEGYVCPKIAEAYLKNPDGVKRDVSTIFNDVCEIKTTVQIEGRKGKTSVIGFHSFRGSLASKLLNSGVPVAVVKEIIGDNLKTIEDHYLTTGVEDVKKAVDILQNSKRKAVSLIERADQDTIEKIITILESKKML